MSEKKTVLVVDDEEDLRDTVAFQFESKGFNVVTAWDGIDALDQLKKIEPDLIVLDMNMPRMNGLEFYEKLKGENEKPKYPVLVLTARANMEQLFTDLDVDGFMAKPFELDLLVKEGEAIIKKNSGAIQKGKGSEAARARKICIVENDPEVFKEMALAFLDVGYIVNSAQSGASAIKRITMDVPDVAMVKLGLQDISGDVVILKLKRRDKTRDIKFILYTATSGEKIQVAQRIAEKEGVDQFVEANHVSDLLFSADLLFREDDEG